MALKYNALTGEFDYVGIPLKTGPIVPTLSGDGDMQLAQIGDKGRVYYQVAGQTYYFEVAGVVGSNININRGQPIGLMGVTYANDVT